MAEIKIKSEHKPTRCEVCHQADQFNPDTGYCFRCSLFQETQLAEIARARREISITLTRDIALKKINRAFYAAMAVGSLALLLTLLFAVGGYSEDKLLEVIILLALTGVFFLLGYGIHRKSRVCASLMFAVYAISNILSFMQLRFRGLIFILVIGYYLFQGVLGTWDYHEASGANENPPPSDKT